MEFLVSLFGVESWGARSLSLFTGGGGVADVSYYVMLHHGRERQPAGDASRRVVEGWLAVVERDWASDDVMFSGQAHWSAHQWAAGDAGCPGARTKAVWIEQA